MRLTVEVPLRASRSEVWDAVSTVGDINREVAPFVRMTDPTHGAHFDAEPWQVGTPVLWQLLFGFIPVDRHRVELVVLPDGRGFRDAYTRSTSTMSSRGPRIEIDVIRAYWCLRSLMEIRWLVEHGYGAPPTLQRSRCSTPSQPVLRCVRLSRQARHSTCSEAGRSDENIR